MSQNLKTITVLAIAAGEHRHKCPKPDCGFVWEHDAMHPTMGDKELNQFHHTCPRCGTEQYEAYYGTELATKFFYVFGYEDKVQNECQEHSGERLLRLWDSINGMGVLMCERCFDDTLIAVARMALSFEHSKLEVFDHRKEQ